MAVAQLGCAYVVVAGNRAKPCQEDVELVRLRELCLEEAALRRLRTCGLRRERHAEYCRLRRMGLQVQVEQLKQQFAALRSDCWTDVPFVGRGLVQLLAKGQAP
jgi:hypothetical protein